MAALTTIAAIAAATAMVGGTGYQIHSSNMARRDARVAQEHQEYEQDQALAQAEADRKKMEADEKRLADESAQKAASSRASKMNRSKSAAHALYGGPTAGSTDETSTLGTPGSLLAGRKSLLGS